MSDSEAGIARERRRWQLGRVALGLGALSCAGSLIVLVSAWRTAMGIYPPARAVLWVDTVSPVFIAMLGLAVVSLVLAGVARRGGQTGFFGIMLTLFAVLILPASGRRHESALKTQCLANTKNLATALVMYTTDYDAFPPADRWTDEMIEYVRSRGTFHCPAAAGACGYAYCAELAGKRPAALAHAVRTVAVFESDRGWNAHGGAEAMTDFARHLGGENLGFADGHARWYARVRPAGETRWNTKWPHEFRSTDVQWRADVRRER